MIAEQWLSYPMGPILRHVLGIDEKSYRGEGAPRPSDEAKGRFQVDLKKTLARKLPLNRDELLGLMEELTAMAMPELTLWLCENHPGESLADSYIGQLNLGAALMMQGELEDAAYSLLAAHKLEPDELSPYINLARVYWSCHDDKQVRKWALAGLALEPNHHHLWELLAKVILVETDRDSARAEVLQIARRLRSYEGLSLAAELVSDPTLKAEYLKEHYDGGGREAAFLVEYTAALGLVGEFEKIPAILWEAESLPHFEGQVPWQLQVHGLQAYLSLEQYGNARKLFEKLEAVVQLPDELKQELAQWKGNLPEATNE